MAEFDPIWPTIGGILIGLSAAMIMLFNGRITGISGIVGGVLSPARGDTAWRAVFVVGLLAGGALMFALQPERFVVEIDRSYVALAGAGLLVGFGTRLGSGCTSGHGVCGISRLSTRSIVATMTFMATGAITVFVVNHLMGGVV
ncbi:MAG: YeeE/YedE family protein [Bradymonadia bacterium]